VSEQVASFKAPTPTKQPVVNVAVIGDSYSAGAGAPVGAGWVDRLSRNQSWNITNFARGGTGYATTVTDAKIAKGACGLAVCPSYPEMIREVAAAAPQIVLVAGGRNDSKVDLRTEASSIDDFYTQLRATLPDATIVAFNAVWDDDPVPPSVASISSAVRESVTAVNGIYLDAGQPLEGQSALISTDGMHPNTLGYQKLFEAKLVQLQQAGIAAR
jgi:lysophospholipase L1-like esterase